MHKIYILSDGTGRTAERAVQAALTQFPDAQVELNLRPQVQNEAQAADIFKEACNMRGFVVHTVVTNELRDFIINEGRLQNIQTIDLMGPLLAQLSTQLAYMPSEQPGLFHELNKAYFQRVEAIEFALRHDDGQHSTELSKAEIILLGVSRTFKTPISMYLAFKGWMTANIPIILNIKVTEIVDEISPQKVFGLITNERNLIELRKIRDKHLGGATGSYIDPSHVHRELAYARQIFAAHPEWVLIDVIHKPIEEVASEILKYMRHRR